MDSLERYARESERASYCDAIWKDAQRLAALALKQDQQPADQDPRVGPIRVEIDNATVSVHQPSEAGLAAQPIPNATRSSELAPCEQSKAIPWRSCRTL